MTSSNKSEDSTNSSGVWHLASILVSLGALGGSIAAAKMSGFGGIEWLYCVLIGLALSAVFFSLLHLIGVLFVILFGSVKAGGKYRFSSAETNVFAKWAYCALIPCFALFDWVGYQITKLVLGMIA